MAGSQSPGLAAHGSLPAGMLRIQQGNQERYVWPVHLPGWLALGWRIAGSSTMATEPLPQAVRAPAVAYGSEPEPTAIQKEPELASGRGKRGRRRNEEEPQPPAGVEAQLAASGTETVQKAAADSQAATDLAVETAAEPGDDSTAEGAAALGALPDDLFSDPLI